HRDIACITLPVHTPTGTSRVAGSRKALEKYGIPWQPAKVKYGDYSLTRGYDACRVLLEEGVTLSALFACNDDTALGAAK
ncbi:LacI family transcriptional regulator, partial [Salmonella enterica subsp. enterica serovar Infantis]